MGGIAWRSMLGLQRLGAERADTSRADSVALLTAGLSLVVALIHLEAAVDHYAEYRLYSAAFVALAGFQALWARQLLRRPTRATLFVGAAGNAAVALLWLASRTVGVPIAPVPWQPEPAGTADLLATVSELAIVAATIGILFAGRSRLAESTVARIAPLLLAVLALSVLYGFGGGHAG
jgi:hypothetical protein